METIDHIESAMSFESVLNGALRVLGSVEALIAFNDEFCRPSEIMSGLFGHVPTEMATAMAEMIAEALSRTENSAKDAVQASRRVIVIGPSPRNNRPLFIAVTRAGEIFAIGRPEWRAVLDAIPMNEWREIATADGVSILVRSVIGYESTSDCIMWRLIGVRLVTTATDSIRTLFSRPSVTCVATAKLANCSWEASRMLTAERRGLRSSWRGRESFKMGSLKVHLILAQDADRIREQWGKGLQVELPYARLVMRGPANETSDSAREIVSAVERACQLVSCSETELAELRVATSDKVELSFFAHDALTLPRKTYDNIEMIEFSQRGRRILEALTKKLSNRSDHEAKAVEWAAYHLMHAYSSGYLEQHVLGTCLAFENLGAWIRAARDPDLEPRARAKLMRRMSGLGCPSQEEIGAAIVDEAGDWSDKVGYLQREFPDVELASRAKEDLREMRNAIVHNGALRPSRKRIHEILHVLEEYVLKLCYRVCGLADIDFRVGRYTSRPETETV